MLVILAFIVLVIYLYYYSDIRQNEYFSKNNTPNAVYNFDNKRVSHEYPKIVGVFGYPTVFEDRPNGFIMWDNVGVFKSIYIKDESVKHDDHCDFVYATVSIHIPQFALDKIYDLSKSIMYDRLKNELTIRCGSLSQIVSYLAMVLEIVHNKKQTGDKYNWVKETLSNNLIVYADKFEENTCNFTSGAQPSLLR
jgi:hypothetical protein